MEHVKKFFPEREQGIMVAMDVTLQKIEKLSIITTVCHHLTVERQHGFTSCSQKLKTVLGKEAYEILEALIASPEHLKDGFNPSSTIATGLEWDPFLEKFKNPIQYPLKSGISLALSNFQGAKKNNDEGVVVLKEAVDKLMKNPKFTKEDDQVEIWERISFDEIITSYQDNGIWNLVKIWRRFSSVALMLLRKASVKPGYVTDADQSKTLFSKLFAVEANLQSKWDDLCENRVKQKQFFESSVTCWRQRVQEAKEEVTLRLRDSIKENAISERSNRKELDTELETTSLNMGNMKQTLSRTTAFVKQATKSLRGRRHYLEASLESLIREYDATVLKYQVKIDDLSLEEVQYSKEIEVLERKFKHVEEKYDEMRAMRRLKELLANMQKAEAIKQNWAARKIQVCWRKYKVAKLRKKRLKGRRKGKRKTPPGKAGSPGKASTSDSRSRSKSQTP